MGTVSKSKDEEMKSGRRAAFCVSLFAIFAALFGSADGAEASRHGRHLLSNLRALRREGKQSHHGVVSPGDRMHNNTFAKQTSVQTIIESLTDQEENGALTQSEIDNLYSFYLTANTEDKFQIQKALRCVDKQNMTACLGAHIGSIRDKPLRENRTRTEMKLKSAYLNDLVAQNNYYDVDDPANKNQSLNGGPNVNRDNGSTVNSMRVLCGKMRYTPSDPIQIKYLNLPPNAKNWISIAKKGAPADKYIDYEYTEDADEDGTVEFDPQGIGQYEGRVYLNWPDNGYTISAKCGFSVGELQTYNAYPVQNSNQQNGNQNSNQNYNQQQPYDASNRDGQFNSQGSQLNQNKKQSPKTIQPKDPKDYSIWWIPDSTTAEPVPPNSPHMKTSNGPQYNGQNGQNGFGNGNRNGPANGYGNGPANGYGNGPANGYGNGASNSNSGNRGNGFNGVNSNGYNNGR